MQDSGIASKQKARRGSALLIGNYRTTLTVMRSLARNGYDIVLGVQGDTHGNERSRYCRETWQHPSLDTGGDAFNAALTKFLQRRPDVRLVYPVTEEAVVHFARRPFALPRGVALVLAPPETVALCQDKEQMLGLATQTGVTMAPWAIAHNTVELHETARTVGWPCVLRPVVAPGRILGRKALVVSSAENLCAKLPAWPVEHGRLLVQRYVAGPRHNVYFAAADGQVSHCVQIGILRGDRADGTGLAVEGISLELDGRLDRATRRLVSRLHYTGVGCAQFLVDARTGEYSFLEVNPRLGANCAIVAHCGVDLPVLAARLAATGVPAVAASPDYTIGARYAWLFGDLAGLQHELGEGRVAVGGALQWLGRAALSSLRADVHLTYSIRDPRPALVNYGRKGRRMLEAILGRVRRTGSSRPAQEPAVSSEKSTARDTTRRAERMES